MRLAAIVSCSVVGTLLVSASLRAQEPETRIVPTTNTVLTGYGTAGYVYRTKGDNQNEFTASVNPIFLFQFQDRILFEAEFEFELEGGVTETGLEYAQVDWIVSDNLVLVGGKFLLPHGVFGERIHPSWINKFPTSPPIYGHHVSEFGVEPLLPVLSDLGAMGRATVRPGNWNVAFNLYATNGPQGEEGEEGEVPEIEFPASSSDNNTDKMVGGRLDVVLPPWAELNISAFSGDYDENSVLDFTSWNVAAEARHASFELRGEYLQTQQEIETLEGFPSLKRQGFYAQLAYRWRNWEPVLRWTQIFDDKLDGQLVEEGEGAWQAGIGLDYWFSPSIAIMAGYEINREDGVEIDNDRLVAHVAYGF
jgi:hypothetical protein